MQILTGSDVQCTRSFNTQNNYRGMKNEFEIIHQSILGCFIVTFNIFTLDMLDGVMLAVEKCFIRKISNENFSGQNSALKTSRHCKTS